MSLIWFYSLFYAPLVLGAWMKRYQQWSGLIMRLTILILEVPIFIYSFWILDLSRIKQYAPIPVIAVLIVLLTLGLSPRLAKRLHRDPDSQGSFILIAGFSNVGTTGGAFICYLLYGLPGLALAYLFLLPYPFLIFTLGFGIAKKHSSSCHLTCRDYILNIITNTFSLIPLLAIGSGLLLNGLDIEPTTILQPIMDAIIKVDLAIMCFAIGMTIKLSQIKHAWKSITIIALLKFVITPLLALIAIFITYGSLAPLSSKIILIQAAMPPAIYAVITANLFKLDRDLVNTLWLANTLLLIPVVALIFIFSGGL